MNVPEPPKGRKRYLDYFKKDKNENGGSDNATPENSSSPLTRKNSSSAINELIQKQ